MGGSNGNSVFYDGVKEEGEGDTGKGGEWDSGTKKAAAETPITYLGKEGAEAVDVMRLASLGECIGSWTLYEMYAGCLVMGAVDAWHAALTKIEELKLDGETFCGGVADIAIVFDRTQFAQIRLVDMNLG